MALTFSHTQTPPDCCCSRCRARAGDCRCDGAPAKPDATARRNDHGHRQISTVLDVDNADVGGFNTRWPRRHKVLPCSAPTRLPAVQRSPCPPCSNSTHRFADAYNTTGLSIESLSVRGFCWDQAGNFRRNGLAISTTRRSRSKTTRAH